MATYGFVKRDAHLPSTTKIANPYLPSSAQALEINVLIDMVIKLIKVNKTPLSNQCPYFETIRDCNMRIALGGNAKLINTYRLKLSKAIDAAIINKELYQLLLRDLDNYSEDLIN